MLPATGSTKTQAAPSIDRLHRLEVVVRNHAALARSPDAEGRHPGARLGEKRVGVAVVAAGETHERLAARRRAGQPQRAHRGFRARGDQPHLLDGRHRVDDLGGELDLALGRRAEGRAPRAAAATASIVSGSACPKMSGPQESTQSR